MGKQRWATLSLIGLVVVGFLAGFRIIPWLAQRAPEAVAWVVLETIVQRSFTYRTASGQISSDMIIAWADGRELIGFDPLLTPEDYQAVWQYDGRQLRPGVAADLMAALDCSDTYVYLLLVRQISLDTATVDVTVISPRSTTIGFECGGLSGDRWTLEWANGEWRLVDISNYIIVD